MQPTGVRVPERRVERGHDSVARHQRQARQRLTDFEVQHSVTRGLAPASCVTHRHRMKRRNCCCVYGCVDHLMIVSLDANVNVFDQFTDDFLTLQISDIPTNRR